MSELAVSPINAAFEDDVVRIIILDGEAFWSCKDACKAMGISKYRNAMSQLDADERTEHLVQTPGGPQTMVFVNEPGLWSLMMISRSPKVRAFKRWITHEVLPAIRATGSYSLAPPPPALTEDEIVHKALAITAKRVETLTLKVRELEPKGEAYDEFLDSRDTLSMKLAGEYLGWGRNQLLDQLRREGILRSGGVNHNLPYARYDRYFHVIPFTAELSNGRVLHTSQVLVWPESVDWIRGRIGMGPRKPRPRG
jgi:prophage antirepressor-like protein